MTCELLYCRSETLQLEKDAEQKTGVGNIHYESIEYIGIPSVELDGDVRIQKQTLQCELYVYSCQYDQNDDADAEYQKISAVMVSFSA